MYTNSLVFAKVGSTFRTALLLIGFCTSALLFFTLSSSDASAQTTPWRYTFNSPGVLLEAGSMADSTSPYFWVNSGGKFIIKDGLGMTNQGALSTLDPARQIYSVMNPLDTGNGYYAQNTLRLITKASWGSVDETVKFRITKTNLTDTPNRDGYSGIFLFGRYKDQHNLYYVGLRHDGQAVIKKKIGGTYHTLGEKQVFGAQSAYDRMSNPNLMPENTWMGLRARFENLANGSVRITLYLDKVDTGSYAQVLSVTDAGTGGAPFTATGKAGIRTDYMDVQFDDFELRNLY